MLKEVLFNFRPDVVCTAGWDVERGELRERERERERERRFQLTVMCVPPLSSLLTPHVLSPCDPVSFTWWLHLAGSEQTGPGKSGDSHFFSWESPACGDWPLLLTPRSATHHLICSFSGGDQDIGPARHNILHQKFSDFVTHQTGAASPCRGLSWGHPHIGRFV